MLKAGSTRITLGAKIQPVLPKLKNKPSYYNFKKLLNSKELKL
jgi:hypothetical protein